MNFSLNNLELSNKTIVIIEDDIPSLKYYETILLNSGANLRMFTDGKDFIDYLGSANEKIDLLMVDFLIPFVNGIECVRFFRKERKSTPVLMISAYFSEQTRNEALIAGCNEYVLKPVYPEKIYCLFEKYLRSAVTISRGY